MDSGYDERGLRLRWDSQGNGDTDQEEASLTGEDTSGGEEGGDGGREEGREGRTLGLQYKFE